MAPTAVDDAEQASLLPCSQPITRKQLAVLTGGKVEGRIHKNRLGLATPMAFCGGRAFATYQGLVSHICIQQANNGALPSSTKDEWSIYRYAPKKQQSNKPASQQKSHGSSSRSKKSKKKPFSMSNTHATQRDIEYLRAKNPRQGPIPIFWEPAKQSSTTTAGGGGAGVIYVGHWTCTRVQLLPEDFVYKEHPRCALLTFAWDRFDQRWAKIIETCCDKSCREIGTMTFHTLDNNNNNNNNNNNKGCCPRRISENKRRRMEQAKREEEEERKPAAVHNGCADKTEDSSECQDDSGDYDGDHEEDLDCIEGDDDDEDDDDEDYVDEQDQDNDQPVIRFARRGAKRSRHHPQSPNKVRHEAWPVATITPNIKQQQHRPQQNTLSKPTNRTAPPPNTTSLGAAMAHSSDHYDNDDDDDSVIFMGTNMASIQPARSKPSGHSNDNDTEDENDENDDDDLVMVIDDPSKIPFPCARHVGRTPPNEQIQQQRPGEITTKFCTSQSFSSLTEVQEEGHSSLRLSGPFQAGDDDEADAAAGEEKEDPACASAPSRRPRRDPIRMKIFKVLVHGRPNRGGDYFVAVNTERVTFMDVRRAIACQLQDVCALPLLDYAFRVQNLIVANQQEKFRVAMLGQPDKDADGSVEHPYVVTIQEVISVL